jgi:DNA polymerase-1
MRSAAKAVNFGIVYGISDFGLARNIGVSRRQAAEFIDRYLTRYAGIKRFMDESVAQGKLQGYVSTMFGRRRYLPELSSANYNTRSFGERAAMNSPTGHRGGHHQAGHGRSPPLPRAGGPCGEADSAGSR